MSADYFDLQVNGYAGVDFNQDGLTAEQLRRACAALESDGVGGMLATIITEAAATMAGRIATLVRLRDVDPLVKRVIAGIHVEGPFISPANGYRGAHPADAVMTADCDIAMRLIDAGGGIVRLVTLAPECDAGGRVTAMLTSRGVAVSAGHTNASMDELSRAVDAGLTLFTHLGNGCPMIGMDRHDNIVQRALHLAGRGLISPCFIADGVHVPLFALGNYLKQTGVSRAIVVTDAIAPAGLGPGTYTLSRWTLSIGDDLVARSPDGTHLVGSAVTMRQSEANLRGIGIDERACRLLLRDNPRKAVGL